MAAKLYTVAHQKLVLSDSYVDTDGNVRIEGLTDAKLCLPLWGSVVMCRDDSINAKQLAVRIAKLPDSEGGTSFWAVPNSDHCLGWMVGVSSEPADVNVKLESETIHVQLHGKQVEFLLWCLRPTAAAIGTESVTLCRAASSFDHRKVQKNLASVRTSLKRMLGGVQESNGQKSARPKAKARAKSKSTGSGNGSGGASNETPDDLKHIF